MEDRIHVGDNGLYRRRYIKMYEFETEEEARESFNRIEGYKILSEIAYYNDPSVKLRKIVSNAVRV
ncbi:hypothetical protein R4Z10_06860 [Niallia sp. XMNu-256]|uniref:hypothetical protein n=1 Tax=Niallia sp. XMNu-256 TaxID=3082444 RepID=UPI0030D542CC